MFHGNLLGVAVTSADTRKASTAFAGVLSDRRTLIAGSVGALLSMTGMAAVGQPIFARNATPEASLPAVPPEYEQFAGDWPMAQGDLRATRTASGASVDASNVGELGVAWELPIAAASGFGAITSNPVVQGNVVYVIDNAGNIKALDRGSGDIIWQADNNVPTLGPNGVAVGYGILVGVLGDTAEVLALNASDGTELWRFQIANHQALGITMAPFVYDGYVIVSSEPGGNTKGTYEGGANGVVYCLDIQTGITRWTWDTVVDDLWGNFRVNSGGGLWYPPSVDVDTGVLYMGIGNAGPFPGTDEFPNGSSRPGANDYANCLVALDPNAGKVLWYLNVKPGDIYDHDNQQSPVLGTVQIGGEDAPVVYSSGKHGYVIAAHRGSGHEIWRVPVGQHKNDGRTALPADQEDAIEILPGLFGGVESPMAFKDGVLYVAAFNFPSMMYATGVEFDFATGFAGATTNLVALDGATGDVIWDTGLTTGTAGSGPTIANDLLFIGTLDGMVRAFALADGAEVWSSQTSAGINAPCAAAGDLLLVPAGSIIAPSAESPDPVPGYGPALIAYQLGATGTVTLAEAEATGATPAATEGEPAAVTIESFDLGFTPDDVSIPADTDMDLTLRNTGVLEHNFRIDDPEVFIDLVPGGESRSLTVNLPAGSYQFYCSVPGHAAAGMVGTLTVE